MNKANLSFLLLLILSLSPRINPNNAKIKVKINSINKSKYKLIGFL